jgi:hypothetical protein
MLTRKNVLVLLNCFYAGILILFIVDYFIGFEIRLQLLKSFVYIGVLIGTLVIIIINLVFIEHNIWGKIGFIFPVGVAFGIIYLNPLHIYFMSSTWKTQTILYENKLHRNINIQHQMQDTGTHGYNNRIVEVENFFQIFSIVKNVNLNELRETQWLEINKDVNELKLKGG